ncbi:conserved Plasmodium protein, unknown function [Plasmodium chabaudi adami]|uniref:Uncharacterized protein n=1 Tax=Plasmodium chabaudi adami TaxID=5826 RepID=A0A1C6YHN7_PLACE|nr:conserved Plasmodium protein, unknown function [Plasmodium chabaudi adami]
MNNMKAFVHKFRRSMDTLKEDDEFFAEKKQLNALNTYFSHSLLYLERLESVIKNINIMISDLNRCLMSFFENDINLGIVQHISRILNTFTDVREQITNHIVDAKSVTNETLEKIKKMQNLCLKKKELGASIEHYEKKIKKLQLANAPNQKHLEKIIRNESKLNGVKTDYLKYNEYIKKGFDIVLENKTNKVLLDARKDLELLLCYFSMMNSVSTQLKDPLKDMYLNTQREKLPVDDNFFLESQDRMNYFYEMEKNLNNYNPHNRYHMHNPRFEYNNYDQHINKYNKYDPPNRYRTYDNIPNMYNEYDRRNINNNNNNNYMIGDYNRHSERIHYREVYNKNERSKEDNFFTSSLNTLTKTLSGYNLNSRGGRANKTNDLNSSGNSAERSSSSNTPLPFIKNIKNKIYKKTLSQSLFVESDDKKDNSFLKIKNILGGSNKPKEEEKETSPPAPTPPAFPQ